MNKIEIIKALNELTKENSKIEFQLVSKTNKNYSFMDTTISDNIQKEIFELLYGKTLTIIECNDLLEFNPIGKNDNTNEILEVSKVEGYSRIIKSRDEEDSFVDTMEELNEVNFYILEINNKDTNIKFFRRYSKTKSLSKGLKYRAIDNKFDKICENIFQVDDIIDFIAINDLELIIFNRYSFEVITDYKDNYMKNLDNAMMEIEKSHLIDNIEEFKKDCKSSIRIAKQFTKAMQCSSIPLILKHMDQINLAITDAGLPIEFINNKFRYENKEQLSILVALLSDKYAKTLICNRITS